ncbi:YL1 nuclear protein-domain-containing protein [Xylaria sp. FL1042]|nr:YL1 nuclear protein-domain-containing protein [Xylaria sp. FL1042]
MATSDDEPRPIQVDEEEKDPLSSDLSDSENELSGDEEPSSKIEWLATGREKRSTAGNRMKSMIAAEEPDDELELLFAEDADDAGFTDVDDDGSDAHMSSSDDDDAQENADDLEGEKELEKQARESRQAARKRKAQEAIPIKFRKKVKIDTSQTPSASVTPAPKPRPRKKSERISWLPSPADMPTRASKRETTMAGKEQLHKQMAEREIKRLQQIEAMERKAKKMEALKKPPMTQAERLAEAALVEKRNAKSLNRWEEAEKQREEERKAKLAALNNRTLEGPVVTFWSGVGEWVDGKLKHVGKIVTIEEKPAKKKRYSAVEPEGTPDGSCEDQPCQTHNIHLPDKIAPVDSNPAPSKQVSTKPEPDKMAVVSVPDGAGLVEQTSQNPVPSMGVGKETQLMQNGVVEMTSAASPIMPAVPTAGDGEATSALNSRSQDPKYSEPGSQPQIPPLADIRPPDLKPPDLQPPSTGLYTTSMFAPPTQSSLLKPSELKPPSNSFLAPPVGVSQNGLSMPMIGYHPPLGSTTSSNVLAPPNPAQRQSPLSMPQTNIHTPPAPIPNHSIQVSTSKPNAPSTPSTIQAVPNSRPSKASLGALKSTKTNGQKHQSKKVVAPPLPPPPPPPPANGKATRNCIILQNFNENAVKDKSVQTRILFGREMSKLPKHGPPVRCVITNHPARYRDPKTGLPYYNAYAFKQIRKLYSGEYKWSSLIGAWIGSEISAATGVPARFLDPDAPVPPKQQISVDPPVKEEEITDDSTKDAGALIADEQAVKTPVLSASQPDNTGTLVTGGQASSNTPATSSGPAQESDKTEPPSIMNGSSSSVQPYAATTNAAFALNMGHEPIPSNGNIRTISYIDSTPSTDRVDTSSNLSGSSTAAMVVPPASSSTPPVVVGQGVANP